MARASRVALNPVPLSNSVHDGTLFDSRISLLRAYPQLNTSASGGGSCVFVCYVTRPISVESPHFSILIIIIAPEPTILPPTTPSRSFTTFNPSLLHDTCLRPQPVTVVPAHHSHAHSTFKTKVEPSTPPISSPYTPQSAAQAAQTPTSLNTNARDFVPGGRPTLKVTIKSQDGMEVTLDALNKHSPQPPTVPIPPASPVVPN
ncbi:hypothetical protein P692DRAFT_20880764 [Suillus brevipes Sb2]|nr:hypothetical protein P692DRAFT_20880764 [Suillus brevipes Sb2]